MLNPAPRVMLPGEVSSREVSAESRTWVVIANMICSQSCWSDVKVWKEKSIDGEFKRSYIGVSYQAPRTAEDEHAIIMVLLRIERRQVHLGGSLSEP